MFFQIFQFMFKDYMGKIVQFEQFDEELYKVVDGDVKNDKYLIVILEQFILVYYVDEWFFVKDFLFKLVILYCWFFILFLLD